MPSHSPDQPLPGLDATELLTKCSKKLASWKSFQEPLPDEIDAHALDLIEDDVRAALRPATNAEVIAAVKRLRMHYGEWSQLTEAEEADIWRDWILDFRSYPHGLLMDACAGWRNSLAKKAPTAGQLKGLVQRDFERLRHLEGQASRARRAIKDPERTWR